MTKEKFIKEFRREVLKEVVVDLNQVMGQSKTAFLSTGLFLELPIKIILEESDEVESTKKLDVQQLDELISVEVTDEAVELTILYADDKHLKHILKVSKKHTIYFTYQYLKSIQWIVRGYFSYAHEAKMFRLVQDREEPFYLIELANTLAINTFVKELLSQSSGLDKWKTIDYIVNSWGKLEPAETIITQLDSTKLKIKKFKGKFAKVTHTDLTYVTKQKDKAIDNGSFKGAQSIKKDDRDRTLAALAERIEESISTATKGTSIGTLFQQVFDEVKINVDWFKDFKRTFEVQVNHKTHESYQSWENIDSELRHIYKAPTEINADTKLKLIIAIDQSGSFHTEDLQKLLYVMKKKSKKINEVHVLIHTTDIIKEYHLNDEYDIKNDSMFREAFSTRHGSGGTSHKAVFDRAEQIMKNSKDELIFISLSDMYSDIESLIGNYPTLKKSHPIWLVTNDGREMNPKIVGGKQITLP